MAQKLLRLLTISINYLKTNLILILIILLFLGTRLFRIDTIPASVYWDEASIGYNAYSVLKTGKDEWGNLLPLHFRAFGEFKLPVYIYSVMASEFVFGLTTLAVRLPAVIFGVFAVLGLYLVIFKLTDDKTISLLSSFLFTITPWFFIFSRTGYEAVAGLALFIWAIYLLQHAFDNKKYLIISTILFVASCYSYNSFRILTPLILAPALIYFLFKKQFGVIIISVVILLLSVIPIYKLYTKDSGLARLQTVGAKSAIITNYFKNYSPNYLFISGDSNPRSQLPNNSQLYYLDILFLSLGIIYIVKLRKANYLSILYFLIIAAIPAAITKENPHALRAILLAPIFAVISAVGIYYLTTLLPKYKNLAIIVVLSLYTLSFENYIYKFATTYNSLSQSDWQFEYKTIFETQKSGCVSDQYAQPYIFALFYQKIDPDKFRETKILNPVSDWGFSTVKSFGNYNFPKKCD